MSDKYYVEKFLYLRIYLKGEMIMNLTMNLLRYKITSKVYIFLQTKINGAFLYSDFDIVLVWIKKDFLKLDA